MPLPTRRLALLAVAAALLLIALRLSSAAAVASTIAVVALAGVLDAFVGVNPRKIGVARTLPYTVSLFSTGTGSWQLANPSARVAKLAWADSLVGSLGVVPRRRHVVIAPRATAAVDFTLAPRRRGRFTPDAIALRSTGPLGLGARQARISVPGQLRVYPSFRSKAEAELRLRKARLLEIGLRSATGLGTGTEFDSLREYQVDDDVRRIDWSATARAQRAIVRTYRAELNQTVIAALDCGRSSAGKAGGVPRLDHYMDAVMALTTIANGLGDKLGLVAFDHHVRATVPASRHAGQFGRVCEAMYDQFPELAESDYRNAFSHILARFPRRTMLVLFTEINEHLVEDYLLDALALVVRDHLVVVASVRDPDLNRWSTDTPTEADLAYRKAAAFAALDSRARAVARLRAVGATVIDAVPGELAPALADAYLRAKSRGRL